MRCSIAGSGLLRQDSPSGVDYRNIDIEALYNDTGFECKADFKDSILKTAAWLKRKEYDK